MLSHAIEELVEAARHRKLIVFCGAGVSLLAPSRAPSWWDIYVAAAQALSDRLVERFPDLGRHLDLAALLAPYTTQELADLVSTRFAGADFAHLLRVVDVADVNENHRALASLAAIGALRAVVTTNFDTLIERAAAMLGAPMTVIAPGAARPTLAGDTLLVKVHGTTVDAPHLIETSTHKAREIDVGLRTAWKPLLEDAVMMVLGYSGADLGFGSVQALFGDAADVSLPIWWLHLPGQPPALPAHVAARTRFVEGQLPDYLRVLRTALGEADFETPVTGRDAGLALRRAMRDWSIHPGIGPWSAATFFLAVSARFGHAPSTNDALHSELLKLALERAQKLGPGAEFDFAEIALALFLGAAGQFALQARQFDEASTILRTAINIFGAVGKMPNPSPRTIMEYHNNLASAWTNYGHAQFILANRDGLTHSLQRALIHTYMGGLADGFLIVLHNTLTYVFAMRVVNRCMGLAECGVRLADRIGAVQSSIELRLLLGCYALERNELWSARKWFVEARHRAVTVKSIHHIAEAEVQLGCIALRCGRMVEGLTMIADAVTPLPNAALLSLAFEQATTYLRLIGVQQEPFSISIERSAIPALSAEIEEQRRIARERNELPWQGAHCRVAADLEAGMARALFAIGVHEFDGESTLATDVGVQLAEKLVQMRRELEAKWVSRNVLARPNLDSMARARTLAVLAASNAQLGFLDEATAQFAEARSAFLELGVGVPADLALNGMWHDLQRRQIVGARRWAADLCAACPRDAVTTLRGVALEVGGWGDEAFPVIEVLRERLGEHASFEVRAGGVRHRHFAGYFERHPAFDATADARLRQATEALRNGDHEQALRLADSLAELGELNEYQAGIGAGLQVRALGCQLPLDEFDAFCDALRERSASAIKFEVLARIETAQAWALAVRDEHQRAADLLTARAWVADLVVETHARISLQAWDARPKRCSQSATSVCRTTMSGSKGRSRHRIRGKRWRRVS